MIAIQIVFLLITMMMGFGKVYGPWRSLNLGTKSPKTLKPNRTDIFTVLQFAFGINSE
ncbi:hypothetical protein L218DRAFT_322476 [Marasmius fiardii PR-910]|nr:hypothetical protein L218DRAFT_322476 [Marasmius fiardii PR-910]